MKCDNVLTKQNIHPRILILGNAPTTGDEAIAIGLALLIREYFPGCHITLASQYPDMYGSISDWINVEVKDFNKLCPPITVKEGLLLKTISRLSALEVLTFPFSIIGRIHPYMKKAYFLSKNYDVVFLQGGPGWKDHTLSRSRAITN